jgi:hypothetical protein
LNKKTEAKALLDNIDITEFQFPTKRFYTILYLTLRNLLLPKKNTEEQLMHLIHETGFERLNHRIFQKPNKLASVSDI